MIGTVPFVIAVGLHQLFFTSMMPLPRWLLVHDVGDLERKLIGLVITVLLAACSGVRDAPPTEAAAAWAALG